MKPILLLLLAAFTAQAFEFTGKVVGVSDGAMAAAETKARAAKAGIWSMANPAPPWDFRRAKGVANLETGQPNTAVFAPAQGTNKGL
jgi:hypothetical protein